MPITRIALVGHCGFDSGSLKRFAQVVAPQAEVTRVNDQRALDDVAGPDTLLLINRVLDGAFRVGGSGVDLIRDTAQADEPPAMMLISNYEDAQQEAIDAGALRGFGKSHIADTNTTERVADTIASL